jgi:hypothetical protein
MHLAGRHHALLFEGDRDAGISAAHAYIINVLGISVEQNPDVRLYAHDRITVEIADDLRRQAQARPFGAAQAFIVSCETVLTEAQNALLKTLEEPADNTHFIFILPSRATLLPTVQSRMLYAGRVAPGENTSSWNRARAFLDAPPGERSAMIAPIIKDKDRPAAQELVRILGIYLHARGTREHARQLGEVAFVERYINNRGSSIKMLLEHLSAVL